MKRLRLLSALGFLLLIFGGMTGVIINLSSGSLRALDDKVSLPNILDGQLAISFDALVNKATPASAALNGWIDGLIFAVTGDAGPQVRGGCAGWLYLTEEIVETPHGEAHLAQRVALAKVIAGLLAERGVKLLVVPVPDKVSLAQEGLCGLPVSAQARSRAGLWAQASAGLASAGLASAGLAVRQVDVVADWPVPGYWRTDTHWNRDGAHHAARRVAAAAVLEIGPGQQAIRLETAGEAQPRVGDLLRLANLERTAATLGPAPDEDTSVTAVIERTGGLLDEAPAPSVLLAGSSYSLNSGFLDYLQAEMSREVVQKSHAGGGFAGALLDVLEKDPELLSRIELVVWEWPQRVLMQPLTAQEQRFLKQYGGSGQPR